MRQLATLILCCVLAIQPVCARDLMLHIASHSIRAEIADTPEAREHGLMQRNRLCEDCGMLFVFPVAWQYQFWMKDTPLPLDIAFISADGRILNIAAMQPYTTDRHTAAGDALYALEMKEGWFARHGVKPGDKLDARPPAAAQ